MKKKTFKRLRKPSKSVNVLDSMARQSVRNYLHQAEFLLWEGKAQSSLSPPILKIKDPSRVGLIHMQLRILTHLFGAISSKIEELSKIEREEVQWVMFFKNKKWEVKLQSIKSGKTLSMPLILPPT
jgi:hypothetical protein